MELKKPNRSPPAESMTSPTKITLLKNRYKHELADIRMEDKVKKNTTKYCNAKQKHEKSNNVTNKLKQKWNSKSQTGSPPLSQ